MGGCASGVQLKRAEFGGDLAGAVEDEQEHVEVGAGVRSDAGAGLQPDDVGVQVPLAHLKFPHRPVIPGSPTAVVMSQRMRGSEADASPIRIRHTRPGQESADLGGVLYAFRRAGARLALLSVTRGEASPLNSTCERLETLRPWELQVAAGLLGISSLTVADYPDGDLSRYPIAELTERVQREIRTHAPDLLLLVDPAAGGPDDAVLAEAACSAAAQAGIPAVARTAPSIRSGWLIDLGAETTAARATQRSAAAAHTSQSEALPELQHHLDLLGGNEQLRWLIPPDPTASGTTRSWHWRNR